MKYLFLYTIACLFLMTACFEKEEEVKKQEEIAKEEEEETVNSLPPEKDIMECERIKVFFEGMRNERRSPPPSIKKYIKGEDYVYETNTGGSSATNIFVTAYWDIDCEMLCSNYSSCFSASSCPQSFMDSLIYVETIWERRDTL